MGKMGRDIWGKWGVTYGEDGKGGGGARAWMYSARSPLERTSAHPFDRQGCVPISHELRRAGEYKKGVSFETDDFKSPYSPPMFL